MLSAFLPPSNAAFLVQGAPFMQLQLSNISYTYPGASSPALTQTTVTFKQGWTGIVGDNGCGKSTLAKLACGELLPDKGNISPHLFHAFCQQDASVAPHNLRLCI